MFRKIILDNHKTSNERERQEKENESKSQQTVNDSNYRKIYKQRDEDCPKRMFLKSSPQPMFPFLLMKIIPESQNPKPLFSVEQIIFQIIIDYVKERILMNENNVRQRQ